MDDARRTALLRITSQQLQIHLENEFIFSVEDISKYLILVLSASFDNFAKTEAQTQRRLLKLKIDGFLPFEMHKKIRLTAPYGFPRLTRHISLCVHLAMNSSAQHQLGQWQISVVDGIHFLYSAICTLDSRRKVQTAN